MNLDATAAALCAAVYLERGHAAKRAAELGYAVTAWFDQADAEAALFTGARWAYLAVRGTEASKLEWSDLWANARALPKRWAGAGCVHEGYLAEAMKLWPHAEPRLRKLGLPYYLTGHSLGGAVATILAELIAGNDDVPDPLALVTFGSPKVGDEDFHRDNPIVAHRRYVNRMDFAPATPLIGFAHGVEGIPLDSGPFDRAQGRGWTGPLRDHSIERYAAALAAIEP